MKATIDRFESDYAVLELDDLTITNIPKILVKGAKEGDIIEIKILKNKTKDTKNKIEDLANKLFK